MINFAKGIFTNRSCARHVRVYGSAIALLLALAQSVTASTCADDSSRELERVEIRQINREIQELQAKVIELEARLNAEAAGTSVQANESPAPATMLSKVVQPPPTPPSPVQEFREDKIVPGVKLRMFGDVG
jgi:hypothetical protein